MRRLSLLTSLALGVLLVAFGCAKDKAPASEAPAADKVEYELFPTTHVADETIRAQIQAIDEAGTFVFAKDSAYAKDLALKHVILVSDTTVAPRGLLRQVTAITPQADGTTVVTTQACPIQRAFRHLHVNLLTRPLDLAKPEVTWDTAPGTTVRTASEASGRRKASGGVDLGDIVFDYYPFNGDNDPNTPEDQVHVVAKMHGKVQYQFGIDFDWPDWDDALGGDILPEISAGYYLYAGAGASLAVDGAAILKFARKDVLAHANLGTFTIWILVFTVSADLTSEVSGGASSRFAMSGGVDASFEVGAKFSSKSGGTLVPPTPSFTYDPVQVKTTEKGFFRVSIGPRIKLKLYDIVGPYAGLHAYGDMTATNEGLDPNACWAFKTGIEGEVGIQIEVWGESLADWGTTYDLLSKQLAHGACEADPNSTNAPDITEPTFTPWSERLNDTTVSNNAATYLEPTVDGRWLLGGDNSHVLAKLGKDGSLLWSKTYTRKDAALPVPLYLNRAISTLDAGTLLVADAPAEIVKLNSFGEVLWAKKPQLPSQSTYGLRAALEDENGNFYVGGMIPLTENGDQDAWIMKLDATGRLLWSKHFGRLGLMEKITDLAFVGQDIAAVGTRFGDQDPDPQTQSFALRMTRDGELLWLTDIKGCGDTNSLALNRLALSHDGDLIAGGSYGLGAWHALLLKMKPEAGALGWANGAANNTLGLEMTDFVQLTDGGYLMAGTLWTAGLNNHLFIARSDSVGRPTWMKRLSDGGDDSSPALALTGEGGVLFAGTTSLGVDDSSYWVSRIPVKKGDFSLPASSGAEATDEVFERLENPCISISADTIGLVDWPIAFDDDTVLVGDSKTTHETLL